MRCGGSIALEIPCRVTSKERVQAGRPTGFSASISDRPGRLARLCRVFSDLGVSIKDIAHDRTFSGPDVSAVPALSKVEAND